MTFQEFCRQLGILPPDSIPPGRWTRCGTEAKLRSKTANVKLCDDGQAGFAIDFATMTEAAVWRASDSKPARRDLGAENAALTARIQMREKEEKAGTERALREWKSAELIRLAAHPYAEKKRLTMMGARGIRVRGETLLVPLWRDGEVISLQRISETGEKRFAAGAPSKGGHFWIERPRAVVTIIAEGWATAMTIFEAVNHSRVCVTFSAANMIEVATRLDWQGMCAVAGDNDHRQPCPWCVKRGEHLQNPPTQPRPDQCRCNPGHSAALAAAKIIGCGVAIPPASDTVTDFNDWFALLLSTREKLAEIAPRPPSPSRLRKAALAYVSARIMGAAKKV